MSIKSRRHQNSYWDLLQGRKKNDRKKLLVSYRERNYWESFCMTFAMCVHLVEVKPCFVTQWLHFWGPLKLIFNDLNQSEAMLQTNKKWVNFVSLSKQVENDTQKVSLYRHYNVVAKKNCHPLSIETNQLAASIRKLSWRHKTIIKLMQCFWNWSWTAC